MSTPRPVSSRPRIAATRMTVIFFGPLADASAAESSGIARVAPTVGDSSRGGRCGLCVRGGR
ncbi:Uncharacterised protein [Mycobacteroides abscessus subsp. abscessus]|nr:Uncharacterised protein [Mycobacteroides abscessus subsp. abscessus]